MNAAGAYVVAKIRQIEYEIGIITGLSRGFEQRRARADGADAPVRVDFELRNEGKLPENWGAAPAARGRFSGTRRINHLSFQWVFASERLGGLHPNSLIPKVCFR